MLKKTMAACGLIVCAVANLQAVEQEIDSFPTETPRETENQPQVLAFQENDQPKVLACQEDEQSHTFALEESDENSILLDLLVCKPLEQKNLKENDQKEAEPSPFIFSLYSRPQEQEAFLTCKECQ